MASLNDVNVGIKTSFTTALEYLFGRLKAERPVTHTVGSVDYAVKADGTLGEPIRELTPQFTAPTLQVRTLEGIVDAYNAKLDELPAEVAIHIFDHRNVGLISLKADKWGRRHVWVDAEHNEPAPFEFGKYYRPEEFLIKFRASFLFNDDAVRVQQVCSTVGSGNSVLVSDDGISQQITVQAGTVTKNSIELPAEGIPLIPWRTFRDANPVMSKFLLRMKGVKDDLPQIAIFEIDQMWMLETMDSIATYFEGALPGVPIIR